MTARPSATLFGKVRDENRAALVAYLPVGFPSVDGSIDAMLALTDPGDGPGVDMIEIGMPYSDPLMDGEVIQEATSKALKRGVRTRDIFTAVEKVANTGTYASVMIYWNLIEHYGVDAFARDLANAGGSGVITPDLTPDEADPWMIATDDHGLDRVFLVAPSSTDARLAMTTQACRGWVYATSVMGVTGARARTSDAAPILVQRVREVAPNLPVGVGLGVSNGEQAAAVAQFADAVIVGSALVTTLLEAEAAGSTDLGALRSLVTDLAKGVRTHA